MKKLDYQIIKNEVEESLNAENHIVLATCAGDHVTARTVYYISNEMKIFILTSTAYQKYKQIQKNENVALCLGNLQIEGVATILGHPNLPENQAYMEQCGNVSKEFLHFTKYKRTVLIEVKITQVERWMNGAREYVDVAKQEAYQVG